jgi:hypothetical protein
LKCIFDSQHIQSENLGKLKEFVEEGDLSRFSYLEKVLGEIEIKFESKTDEICVFDEFEGSVLQEKLFLALIEVEEKYINKFLLPKNHYENDVSSTHALSGHNNQDLNETTVKISKYLEGIAEPNEREEIDTGTFKFCPSEASEEIKKWVIKILSES